MGGIRRFTCNTAVFIQLARLLVRQFPTHYQVIKSGGRSSVRVRETPDVKTTVRSANPPHLCRAPLDQVRGGREEGVS